MNKIAFVIISGIIAITLFSCSTGNQVAKTQQSAQQAFDQGNYTKALNLWESIINSYKHKGAENQCPVYTDAGVSALKLGQTDKAIDYLKQATWSEFANENTYLTLAGIYRQKDNLSLELVNLESYIDKYPTGDSINEARKRLFELYVESDNLEKAINLWEKLTPEQQLNKSLLEGYLKVNDKLGNNSVCMEISNKLLKADKNNKAALSWLANYYFWKAEKRYKKELDTYNKHKTRKQYAHLLKVLDEVTVQYKKSLNYANRLYKVDPTAKTAGLLSRCYNRLGDKQKSKYYKTKAGKN